ncbi:MAG TPA: hypothetical protein VFB39_18500 [Solirubrobacteraceae bacterium]|nr:hypothetical protein [Solirubrobacteraceae bacterium]
MNRGFGKGLVAIAVSVALGSGCAGGGEHPKQDRPSPLRARTQATPAVAMMRMPVRYEHRCRSSPVVRAACPRLIPKVPHVLGGGILHGLVAYGPSAEAGGGLFSVFDMEHGVPHEQNLRNRPPRMLHLTIVAGPKPGNLFGGMPYPGRRRTATLSDTPVATKRQKPLFFGERLWGGHMGALFLAPSYPFGGQIGGHLTFWWRRGRDGYVVSIHAWQPLSECADVLRQIVTSTK